ncbi:MAG: DUF362 domain-containing protein [Chloroflexota bacterium]|nr:DUF362 domain-containing protein [Chloroflexota bacterium]
MAKPQEGQKVAVALARGESLGDSIRRAIDLAGGLGFIQPGQTVLIKPNANSADPYPATTNPDALYEVVRLVWERDPKRVLVGDRSMYRIATMETLRKLGLYDAAGEARAEIVPFDDLRWVRVHPQGAEHWGPEGFRIPGLLEEVDHIISLPCLKTHFMAAFSLSLKNAVGIVHPEDRLGVLHRGHQQEPRFGSLIAEINLAYKVSLVLLDATKAMVTGGPSQGDVVSPGLVLASRDRVAIDAAGLALLKLLGTEKAIMDKGVWEQPQIRRAAELGLGVAEAAAIDLRGYQVPELDKIRQNLL